MNFWFPSQEDPLEEENDNLLQYYCLEIHRQRNLQATVYGLQ